MVRRRDHIAVTRQLFGQEEGLQPAAAEAVREQHQRHARARRGRRIESDAAHEAVVRARIRKRLLFGRGRIPHRDLAAALEREHAVARGLATVAVGRMRDAERRGRAEPPRWIEANSTCSQPSREPTLRVRRLRLVSRSTPVLVAPLSYRTSLRSRFATASRSMRELAMSIAIEYQASLSAVGSMPFRRRKTIAGVDRDPLVAVSKWAIAAQVIQMSGRYIRHALEGGFTVRCGARCGHGRLEQAAVADSSRVAESLEHGDVDLLDVRHREVDAVVGGGLHASFFIVRWCSP